MEKQSINGWLGYPNLTKRKPPDRKCLETSEYHRISPNWTLREYDLGNPHILIATMLQFSSRRTLEARLRLYQARIAQSPNFGCREDRGDQFETFETKSDKKCRECSVLKAWQKSDLLSHWNGLCVELPSKRSTWNNRTMAFQGWFSCWIRFLVRIVSCWSLTTLFDLVNMKHHESP